MSAMPGSPPSHLFGALAGAKRTVHLLTGKAASSVARARVPVARPRGKHEEQARVRTGAHLVALCGVEHREQAGPAGQRAPVVRDLDLAVDDDEIGALVDLMVLELLAGGQLDRDRARRPARRVQDLRTMRL